MKKDSQPKQETILIKNATVWTNEKEGVLQNTDVLLKMERSQQLEKIFLMLVQKLLMEPVNMFLLVSLMNIHILLLLQLMKVAQCVTSEVRIADNLNPDDINIYRQLSGGVTTSHILHGSANVIGGQTQLIKLRWGANAEDLKFKNWDGQIKFALGENVKRSASTAR